MSLQVWLPLTQDTRNQGLLNLPTPWDARSRDTGGKLGQYCYSDNAIYHINNEWLGNTWSLACWVKSSGWSQYNDIMLAKNATESTAAQFYLSIIGGTQLNIGCNAGSQTLTVNYTFATNTWYHIASTYDGNTLKLYLNGNEIGTKAYVSTQTAGMNNLGIGCRSTNAAGTSATGGASKRMNDVRIYNHCLSQMEIKEISKGLVLHYPLSDKYIEDTTNLITGITSGGQTTWANNILTTSGTNADTYFTLNLSENIVNGTQYTISCDAENIPPGTCWTFPLGQQSNTSLLFQIYNGHNEYTFTANNISWGTNRCFMDDGGSPNSARYTSAQCKLYNFQLEKKDHATGFAGYGKTRTSTVGYDCSGYCNNGVRVGTLSCSSDTPRYNVSTHFNGSSAIKNNNFPFSSNQWTASFWYKFTTAPSAYQGFLCLSRNAGGDADKKIAAMPNSNYIWIKFESINYTLSSLKTNEWCHIALTCDGNIGKVYENGILKYTTGSVGTILTNCDDFVVGARANSADAATTAVYLNGNMSDVRLYATALSAEDILELYHTAARIDNVGNTYVYQYIET